MRLAFGLRMRLHLSLLLPLLHLLLGLLLRLSEVPVLRPIS